jgi:hypothetical protein
MSRLNPKLSIGCLVANVVGGDYGPLYQHEVERLLRHNGSVWLATRLKALWTAALHLRNGDPDKAIQLYQENSISYHRDGTPKGPFRRAITSFLNAERPSVIRRWSAILRFYTGMVVSDASPTQVRKIKESIQGEGVQIPNDLRKEFQSEFRRFLKKKPGPKKGTTWSRSASWDSAFAQSLKGTTRYFSPIPCPKELKERFYGSFIHSLLTTHRIPVAVGHRVRTLEPSALEEMKQLVTDTEPIGKVFFVFEGGCKVRCVAQPNGWTQLAFRPLHSILSKMQRSFPESCVDDQKRGVEEAMLHKELYSVDLSSATDRLPRSLQEDILNMIGLSDYADALEEVASSKWSFPDGTTVSYRVGQPMGLYGSFPLLNITNCLIGRMACRRNQIYKDWERHFRVVGDDIIFFEKKVASTYKTIMSDLGVTISPTKTFEGKVGQFAGFTILPSRGKSIAFRPYKHPPRNQVTNVISFLRSLGSGVKRISPKWEKIYHLFEKTAGSRALDDSQLIWDSDIESPMRIEHIDDRWVHSLTNLCGLLDEGQYSSNLDLVYKERPGESAYPLFHEPRMTHILGYGPNFEVNSKLEMDPHRVDRDLWSDPLFRESALAASEDEKIPVREHERIYVRPDGTLFSTRVKKFFRKKHR